MIVVVIVVVEIIIITITVIIIVVVLIVIIVTVIVPRRRGRRLLRRAGGEVMLQLAQDAEELLRRERDDGLVLPEVVGAQPGPRHLVLKVLGGALDELLELFHDLREMGGDPRNPAPRNHLLVCIVKPSGCHCIDACGGQNIVECRPLLGALPLSLTTCFT